MCIIKPYSSYTGILFIILIVNHMKKSRGNRVNANVLLNEVIFSLVSLYFLHLLQHPSYFWVHKHRCNFKNFPFECNCFSLLCTHIQEISIIVTLYFNFQFIVRVFFILSHVAIIIAT